ncbi:transposase [Persicobacter psychrovividus]|uniref:Transposase IS200-like domain-containing protein n=1 Tax=Persicobacter psychrovividus TaxID=387638 RepID=A0ABM7VC76_9BACT|nr:hypothetical protein PEPS_08190 [Persicobacter psychrovividus]
MNRDTSQIGHRKSLRLKGFDYSNQGLYFVTINTNKHHSLFGKIQNEKMVLNSAGIMVERWYFELENKFESIKCLSMVVMPNHFHCIIQIIDYPHINKKATLGRVIQWFKTMTTNEYIRRVKGLGWTPFDKKLWHWNYWEHIIRNDQAFDEIENYILTNPTRWESDRFYCKE